MPDKSIDADTPLVVIHCHNPMFSKGTAKRNNNDDSTILYYNTYNKI
jgi:hypothetical protein